MDFVNVADVFEDVKRRTIGGIKEELDHDAKLGKEYPEGVSLCEAVAEATTPCKTIEIVGTWFVHEEEILDEIELKERFDACSYGAHLNEAIQNYIREYLLQYGAKWLVYEGREYFHGRKAMYASLRKQKNEIKNGSYHD